MPELNFYVQVSVAVTVEELPSNEDDRSELIDDSPFFGSRYSPVDLALSCIRSVLQPADTFKLG